MTVSAYPDSAAERTRWILERRPAKNAVQPDRPYAVIRELERTASGECASVGTIFLTNRECPWKCLMCDLWRNTAPAPPGSIPGQIRRALPELRGASVLKLYNSGSFFDTAAIPRSDWPAIASLCESFRQIIVECHPKLIDAGVLEFARMLKGSMEVALGLETCHPTALEKLNKRICPDDVGEAAGFLKSHGIAVRIFLLAGPPFIPAGEQDHWGRQSIQFAFDAGADVVSIIPTRPGNGALDELMRAREFAPPGIRQLEEMQDFGISLQRGRVFADTWDLERFGQCPACLEPRRVRLERVNLSQEAEPRLGCSCGT